LLLVYPWLYGEFGKLEIKHVLITFVMLILMELLYKFLSFCYPGMLYKRRAPKIPNFTSESAGGGVKIEVEHQ
jgi:hypothetical protein